MSKMKAVMFNGPKVAWSAIRHKVAYASDWLTYHIIGDDEFVKSSRITAMKYNKARGEFRREWHGEKPMTEAPMA